MLEKYKGEIFMIAERSVAVLSNMLDDIKKIWFFSLFVVQSIFIVFYAYSIYNNIENKRCY